MKRSYAEYAAEAAAQREVANAIMKKAQKEGLV